MSCRNGIHYFADTGEAYEPGCDCMKEKVAALKAEVALIRACASSRLDEITRLKLDAILLKANTPTRQPLREYCKDCDDTCNHPPRGGEGESGGHKERP